MNKIYVHPNVLFSKFMLFMKIAVKQCSANLNWVEIYKKASEVDSKYNLNLPLKQFFPFEGMFVEGTQPEKLF